MKAFAIAIFLLLFMHWTGPGSGETVLGTRGETVLLPCYNLGRNTTPSSTRWTKDGGLIPGLIPGLTADDRVVVLENGSLSIRDMDLSDEGTYMCDSGSHDNDMQSIALQVVSGPDNVTTDFTAPAGTLLPNGTRVVFRGSSVFLNCSSRSDPSQNLSWGFQASGGGNASSLARGSGPWLGLSLVDVQPNAQGLYTCHAQNTLSQRTASSRSTEMLVYYAPERHPDCEWRTGEDSSHVLFTCSWSGAYPAPRLLWGEDHRDGEGQAAGQLFSSQQTDSLGLWMNRTRLQEGLVLKCEGQHPALPPGEEKACSFTLKSPYPQGEPLVSALEGTNVTLSCTEDSSVPPANTTWLRTEQQVPLGPSPRYQVSLQGPILTLTIVNVTKLDEGLYFCRSENPLMVRELEVYLTVKTSSAYTGAIIGVFLAILVVGSGAVIAKTVYSSRDRICLGNGFGRVQEERGDVLCLVESDEDQEVFRDPLPRLPPLPNGLNNTTLVQIHRIPSGDHEDTEVVEESPDQGQQENTDRRDPLNLVTF